MGGMTPPAIAIIVPVFKHPGLLPEALDAALAQRGGVPVAIVIVDDGCPFEETRTIASAYALAEERVTYLRKRNGGLSSARNVGIDYALRAWPGLEAIYFLDADNRLTPTAMANALGLLRQAGVDWVYPSIDKFGIEWSGNYQAPYSRLAHVTFDNICEAGSLVHRRVFDAGIRFDETMKAGYEDWEFWMQALARGFRGRCHPSFGLEYRQRGESMLRDSNRQRAGILAYMREKHRDLFSLRNLLAWEHEEAPRFALFTDAAGEVLWFSDVEAPPRRMTLDQHAESFAAEEVEPETLGTPPYAVWLPAPAVAALRQAGLLANLLWHLQRLCARHQAVAIHLEADRRGVALELDAAAPASAPIGFAAGQAALREAIRDQASDGWLAAVAEDADSPQLGRLVLRFPCAEEALLVGAYAPTPVATAARLRQDHDPARRRRWIWRKAGATPAIRSYADYLATAVGADHVMPRARGRDRRRHVGFAVPDGVADGVGRVAAALATALRRAGCATHLFVLGAPVLTLGEDLRDAFDSISFLGRALPMEGPHDFLGQRIALAGDLEGAEPALLGLLTELDVLVCSHVPALSAVLGDLRKQGTKVVGHLHALERSALGRGIGHPYLALAFEHVHDLLLAPSQELLDWLRGAGVPEAKLCLLPPAATLSITAEERDRLVTARRSRRPGMLRVALLLGPSAGPALREARLRLVALTRQAGLPIDWVAAGEALDGALRRRLGALGVGIAETLADAVASADLLLPEMAEAAALGVRDAQLLGCVPVVPTESPAAGLVRGGAGLIVEDEAALLPLLRDLAVDPGRVARLSAAAAAEGAAAPGWPAATEALRDRLVAWFPPP